MMCNSRVRAQWRNCHPAPIPQTPFPQIQYIHENQVFVNGKGALMRKQGCDRQRTPPHPCFRKSVGKGVVWKGAWRRYCLQLPIPQPFPQIQYIHENQVFVNGKGGKTRVRSAKNASAPLFSRFNWQRGPVEGCTAGKFPQAGHPPNPLPANRIYS